jgi:hypothetical protein
MDNRTDYIIRNLIYESFSQTSAYHLQYNRTYHDMTDLLPVNIIHIIKSFDSDPRMNVYLWMKV